MLTHEGITIAGAVLAPSVTRSPAHMALNVYDTQVLVYHTKELQLLVPTQSSQMIKKCKYNVYTFSTTRHAKG